MRSLSLLVLLVPPDTRTLTFLTFHCVEYNQPRFSKAIAIVIVAITPAVYLIIRLMGKTRVEGLGESD
jgi:ABC-type Fe3+ transport system permease subunit